jgi:hypothetical protein
MQDANNVAPWTDTQEDLSLTNRQNLSGAVSDLTGISNTNTIVSYSTNSAANLAINYNSGIVPAGCSQWFLPAIGQVIKILNQFGAGITTSSNSGKYGSLTTEAVRVAVFTSLNSALTAAGGSGYNASHGYHSSTEYRNDGQVRWTFVGSDGPGIVIGWGGKSNLYRVRPVLAF